MNYILSKKAIKAVLDMDVNTAGRIFQAILKIPKGDIARIEGKKGLFRLRLGDWRLLFFRPDNDTILIEAIAPRGNVYDRL